VTKVPKKLLSTDFPKGMPSAHELSRIKKYIIKIRENQLYLCNPRAINIVASLRYFFPQRVKILLK
jgi:hypothetical protein